MVAERSDKLVYVRAEHCGAPGISQGVYNYVECQPAKHLSTATTSIHEQRPMRAARDTCVAPGGTTHLIFAWIHEERLESLSESKLLTSL